MNSLSRRHLIRGLGASCVLASSNPFHQLLQAASPSPAPSNSIDSRAMQLYRSLSDEQRAKICLAVDDPKRQFVSNWWYVHKEHRIHNTFDADQQALIGELFDSMHSDDFQDVVRKQVQKDMFGKVENTPSVGFFGNPEDEDFEFIYTGHHVTRRCNAHTDKGQGFGGAPIFYGHFATQFRETGNHVGNPFWYQGLLFNEFVESMDGGQQEKALVGSEPRSERGTAPIRMRQEGEEWPGLSCAELSPDQQEKLLDTMKRMMEMFRPEDVDITLQTIRDKKMMDRLFVSYYDGKYDIGDDRVWDTWQIEGPDMVWYFRGFPHIHTYFHVKS